MRIRHLAVLCALVVAGTASAATSTTVLKTSTTWDGAAIHDLCTKCPEVDAVVVDIEPNGMTPVHLHPVNNYAYVLDGEVTVETGRVVNGALVVEKTATFKKGDAFAELVDKWHQGRAGPQGVKILVWYMTEVGRTLTVPYAADRENRRDSRKDRSRCERTGEPTR